MQFVTDFEDILPAKKLESKQRMICIWINRSICLSGASFFKANKLDFCFARAFFTPTYYLARVIGRVIKNWDTSPDLLQSMLGANKHELNINKLLNPLFFLGSLLLPCFPNKQVKCSIFSLEIMNKKWRSLPQIMSCDSSYNHSSFLRQHEIRCPKSEVLKIPADV